MYALTESQSKLLDFIKVFGRENPNRAPTLNQMAVHMGLASKSGVHRKLRELEERGFIRRQKFKANAIEVVDPEAPKSNLVGYSSQELIEELMARSVLERAS